MYGQKSLFGEENYVGEVPGADEGIDDVEFPNSVTDDRAVVSATDWTTETIISQINKGNIQLDPKFQRRDAWDAERKSRYIESLILGMPVPQLVLAESKLKRGAYIVIDGKQRLLSIRQFAAEANDDSFKLLRLTGLGKESPLNGKNLVDLSMSASLTNQFNTFENQPIRTVVIRGWTNESFLYQVFLRLNTGSVPLSPQELRQALHPGKFVDYVDERSVDSKALHSLFGSDKPDFRMRDVELLVRYYAFKNFLQLYSGDMKDFLDRTCLEFNKRWSTYGDEIRQQADEFESAYFATFEIFSNRPFRRWTGKGYQSPYNRAIFDIMMFYFSIKEIRENAVKHKPAIEQAFMAICLDNSDFSNSIEVSTKTMGATFTRFSTWARVLRRILTVHVPEPVMTAKRIMIDL